MKKNKKTESAELAAKPNLDGVILHEYTEDAYLRYAIASVKERALPQIQDGQKPVQKRILYAMRELGLGGDAKPVKSARVVGDVIGRLHPHGDTAVYDALVRMAQDFTLRYPIIEGQGNFGSRDGDSAAAYRYCFAAGTRVSTGLGLLPIESLPGISGLDGSEDVLTNRCELPLDLPVSSRGGQMRRAMFWVNSGFQETVTVRTRRGYEVRCTPNEPLLVLDYRGQLQWRDAESLSQGDVLTLKRKPVPIMRRDAGFLPGYPKNPAVAELAGFVCSGLFADDNDGYEIRITDRKAAARFQAIVSVVLPGVYATASIGDGCTIFKIRGAALDQFLARLSDGLSLTSFTGIIPEAAFRASPVDTVFFLRGFSECTGGIKKKIGVQFIEFVCVDRKTAQDLKALLLCQTGLISGMVREVASGFMVRIGGKQTMTLFENGILFAHVSATLLKKSITNRPVDPTFDGKVLTAFRGAPVAAAGRKVLALKSPGLSPTAEEADAGQYFFEPVVSVTAADPCFTYDLTVPETHAFIANGFIAHNTECRLAAFSDVLLSEINRGTVGFKPNFDNTASEPVILPARLPVILLNGSMGIAVGMACNIPPHNLAEVCAAARLLIEKPKAFNEDILSLIQGPDFPDGGQLISTPDEVKAAYEVGRGALRMRARYIVEELARGQWQIVINELPYQISAKRILEQLEELCNPQPGKSAKSISQSQAYLKQAALSLLEKATDESGKDDVVRLVLMPRSSKQSVEELMGWLFANTDLEKSISINLTFIGIDGSPQTRGIHEMLRQWAQFRVDTVAKRIAFDLEKVRRRIHVLEGRMLVFLSVEKVIKTIRESDDPQKDLMTKFKLSEIQAEDILEMRLRQLARLEGIRIEKELQDAKDEAAVLAAQISTDKALRKQVVYELDADIKRYATPRRTLIKVELRAESQAAVAKAVVDEPITVLVSKNLWIRARIGHEVDPATVGWKAGDGELAIVRGRTTLPVIFLDSKGRGYSIDGAAIPAGRGDGVPLSTLIELQAGAKLLYVLAGDVEQEYVFCGSQGYGFRAPLKSLVARPRAGKAFITLQENEVPLRPALSDGTGFVACGASDGRMLIFPLDEIKQLDKGKGVKILELAEGERMTALLVGPGEPWELTLEGREKPLVVKGEEWRKFCMHRARRGCQLPKKAVLVSS